MPDIDFIRAEIVRMRIQVGRQRREMLELREAGISTTSAEALLQRMLDQSRTSALSAIACERLFPSRRECWEGESGEILPGRDRPARVSQSAQRGSSPRDPGGMVLPARPGYHSCH